MNNIEKIWHNRLLKMKKAQSLLAILSSAQKNKVLTHWAKALQKAEPQILEANAKDVRLAQSKNLSPVFIDRLTLNPLRLKALRQSLKDIKSLPDPVGEVTETLKRKGLLIKRVRRPLGNLCMIFEARPGVVVDAASLCLKSGNAILLRGGSEAFNTQRVLVGILQKDLVSCLKDKRLASVIDCLPQKQHTLLAQVLKMTDVLDVVIPRGSKSLMDFMAKESRVPVIKHDQGVCSLFVDETANLDKALEVVLNAKVQRPGVCNALETLYVHQKIMRPFLRALIPQLQKRGCEIRADRNIYLSFKGINKASEKDWSEEYLDLILSIKTVKGVNEAIECVQKFSSGHTDGILSESPKNIDLFLQRVESSCVTVNTSTRFNDGFELGLGAEMGISTSRLKTLGPMGLKELTTTRFEVISAYKTRG